MGAMFMYMYFMGAIIALTAAMCAAWLMCTLTKYAAYRVLKVGAMPMREYFRHYWHIFSDKWGI